MPENNTIIQDFAFIGVENLFFLDKKTKEPIAQLKFLVSVNLNDTQPIEYLRGGFGNDKLLGFKGDRDTSLTVSSAATNPDLLQLQLDTEFEEIEQKFITEETIDIKDGTFTLNETPAAGEPITVWAIDDRGKRIKLAKADTAGDGSYAIADKVISTAGNVNKIYVVYYVTKIAKVLKAKETNQTHFAVVGMLVAQEIGTGDTYRVQLDAPSCMAQLNNQVNAKNEGGVPDNVEITVDMLKDAVEDYTYKLSFRERI